jgi:hypothetical protein
MPRAVYNSLTGSCSLAVENARGGLGLRGTVDRWDESPKSPKQLTVIGEQLLLNQPLTCHGLDISLHQDTSCVDFWYKLGIIYSKRTTCSRATPAQFLDVTSGTHHTVPSMPAARRPPPVGQTPAFAQHRINRQRKSRWTGLLVPIAAGDER